MDVLAGYIILCSIATSAEYDSEPVRIRQGEKVPCGLYLRSSHGIPSIRGHLRLWMDDELVLEKGEM